MQMVYEHGVYSAYRMRSGMRWVLRIYHVLLYVLTNPLTVPVRIDRGEEVRVCALTSSDRYGSRSGFRRPERVSFFASLTVG